MYAESEKIHWRWTCLEYDARYGVRKFEEAGGFVIFWKGVREKGGSDEPPNPPGYEPVCTPPFTMIFMHTSVKVQHTCL